MFHWREFKNATLGYAIQFPPYWTLDAKDPEAVVVSSSDFSEERELNPSDRLVKMEVLRIDRENLDQVRSMGMGSFEKWASFSELQGVRLKTRVLAPSITVFYPVGHYSYLIAAYYSLSLPKSFFKTIELVQRSFRITPSL